MTFNSNSEPVKSNKNETVSQTSINETKDASSSSNETNIWLVFIIKNIIKVITIYS